MRSLSDVHDVLADYSAAVSLILVRAAMAQASKKLNQMVGGGNQMDISSLLATMR